jgi:hypothetical protein
MPFIGGFLCAELPSIARYCAPGGVRVVSPSLSYHRDVVSCELFPLLIKVASPQTIDGLSSHIT